MESLSQQHETLGDWYQMVDNYTTSALTYSQDVFPALSGIAKVFAAKLQDEYVAGMWKTTLVSQLLWYSRENSNPIRATVTPWRAPSWSWASRSWPSMEYIPGWASTAAFAMLPVAEELAEVKNVICETCGDDSTGQLASAHLTLRTKVIPARINRVVDRCNSTRESQYDIHFGDEFTITKVDSPSNQSLCYKAKGYFDLSDPRLAEHIASLGVAIAQIASCSGMRDVRSPYGMRARNFLAFKMPDKVRFYLVLARDIDHCDRSVRIGLMGVTVYERDITLCYYPQLEHMSTTEIEKEVEVNVVQRSAIFDLFDGKEDQDITIW